MTEEDVLYIPVADINNNNSTPSSKLEGETRVVVEDLTTVNYGNPRSIASSRPDDYAKFIGHMALLHHETVTPASVTPVVITDDLFRHYRSEVNGTPLGRKIERFSYMRGKFRVRVAVQGSSVLAGKIVLAFQPFVTNRSSFGPTRAFLFDLTEPNSMVVPHLVVDPSKTESLEIVLDCPTPTGHWSMQSVDNFGSYRVIMYFISPLFSGTATVPDLSLCIYGGLDEASLEGITFLAADEFEEELHSTPRPSDIAGAAGEISGVVGRTFPWLSPFTTIFSRVAGVAGAVLRAFGYSRPPRLVFDYPLLTRTHEPPMHSAGPTSAPVLGASQSQSLGISPVLGGADGNEMSFEHICKIKGLVAKTAISPTSASGAFVTTLAVNPTLCLVNGLSAYPTPLCGVALPFEYWTGDILVDIEVVASVFHRATICIAWDSNCGAGSLPPPTLESAQATLPNTIVTISGNTSVTIRVPWAQQVPWLYVLGKGANGSARTPRASNGFLHIFVVNPVTSNGSTSNLPVNIYYSSDNIRFASPQPDYLPTYGSGTIAAPDPTGVITFLSADPLVVEPTSIDFGPKSDLSFVGFRAFGEIPGSVKELSQKSLPFVSTNLSLVTTDEGEFITFSVPVDIPVAIDGRLAVSAATAAAGVVGLTSAAPLQTWFGYFAAAYVGVRGSMRIGFTLESLGGAAYQETAMHWASYDPYLGALGTPTVSASVLPPSAFRGLINKYSTVSANRTITPMLEVVVPAMISTDFTTVGDVVSATVPGRVFHSFQMKTAVPVAACTWTQWAACGDDVTFCRFTGFPTQLATGTRN